MSIFCRNRTIQLHCKKFAGWKKSKKWLNPLFYHIKHICNYLREWGGNLLLLCPLSFPAACLLPLPPRNLTFIFFFPLSSQPFTLHSCQHSPIQPGEVLHDNESRLPLSAICAWHLPTLFSPFHKPSFLFYPTLPLLRRCWQRCRFLTDKY